MQQQTEKEQKKTVISKWGKPGPNGEKLQQVVIKTPAGKNKKGKQIYSSKTKHEVVK